MPRPLLRFAGLALLILAALRAQSLGPEPWMPTRGSEDNLEARIVASRSSAEQKAWVDRAIAWSPLEWNLYFQRGLLAEETGQFRAAKEDFRRSLFLLPDSFTLPISIAEVCRGSDLNATMDAWREALRRSGPLRAARFRELFDEPNLDERTRLQMATLAGDDPEMQMIALVRQDRPDFEWSRENLLAANPTLAGVDPELERQFFDRWAQDGDAAKLDADWLEHPEWEAAGWRGHARALARVGLFDEAVEAALKELPAPKLPASRSMPEMDALKNYLMQPKDPFAGIELYLAQKAAGENDEALKTLQSVAALPDAPPFVPYLLAQGLLAAGQNEAAWNAIAPLLDRP